MGGLAVTCLPRHMGFVYVLFVDNAFLVARENGMRRDRESILARSFHGTFLSMF